MNADPLQASNGLVGPVRAMFATNQVASYAFFIVGLAAKMT
jgi:hypothetical protein